MINNLTTKTNDRLYRRHSRPRQLIRSIIKKNELH